MCVGVVGFDVKGMLLFSRVFDRFGGMEVVIIAEH